MMRHAFLLGSLTHGAVSTALSSNGYKLKTKILNSSVQNWEKTVKLIESTNNKDDIILMKATEYILFLLCLDEYKEVANKLLKAIKSRTHTIFVYEDNLFGQFTSQSEVTTRSLYDHKMSFSEFCASKEEVSVFKGWCYRYELQDKPEQVQQRIIDFLSSLTTSGFNVIPYKRLLDIEQFTTSFVESTVQGLLLRLYVPGSRLYSREIGRLLELFREYTSISMNEDINLSQKTSQNGITYTLSCKCNSLNKDSLPDIYRDFHSFVGLCNNDPESALEFLKSQNIPSEKASEIFARYAKETRRLLLDIKHQRETRLLTLQHRFEAECSDLSCESELKQLLPSLVLEPSNPCDVFAPSHVPLDQKDNVTPSNPITYIENFNGVLISELNGNLQYNEFDRAILELIAKHSKDESQNASLSSDLCEIKDPSTSPTDKLTASQRIKSFLSEIYQKGKDKAIEATIKGILGYLTGLL